MIATQIQGYKRRWMELTGFIIFWFNWFKLNDNSDSVTRCNDRALKKVTVRFGIRVCACWMGGWTWPFQIQILQGAAANLVFNQVVGSDWKAALQLNDWWETVLATSSVSLTLQLQELKLTNLHCCKSLVQRHMIFFFYKISSKSYYCNIELAEFLFHPMFQKNQQKT